MKSGVNKREYLAMRGVDETLEIVRRAIMRVDGVDVLRPIAMVAPITVCPEVSGLAMHTRSLYATHARRGEARQGKV
jgi:hypothetical protein